MSKLKFIKLVVFFLTSMIIFGMFIAGITIYQKARRSTPKNITINLAQPQGSRIVSTQTSSDMLYLHILGGGLPERIIAIRPSDQSPLATINLN